MPGSEYSNSYRVEEEPEDDKQMTDAVEDWIGQETYAAWQENGQDSNLDRDREKMSVEYYEKRDLPEEAPNKPGWIGELSRKVGYNRKE